MVALQILSTKDFMSHLLAGTTFHSFLLEDAIISTANTYQIDGHINKDFFSPEELEDNTIVPYDFSTWEEIKPMCFQIIKGTHTPTFFKFVLQLKPQKIAQLFLSENISFPLDQIKALVLTIKYDGSQVFLTTGSSYHTFIMSKEPEIVWDNYFQKFLTKHQMEFKVL